MRTVETRSRGEVAYCPDRTAERKRESSQWFEDQKRDREPGQHHDADLALNQKLDGAEFEVIEDAGPEEGAFRPGARLTYYEIFYMLKNEGIAVNSVLLDVESQRRHRVLRGRGGHLVLDPPYTAAETYITHVKPRGISNKPCLRRRGGKQVAG